MRQSGYVMLDCWIENGNNIATLRHWGARDDGWIDRRSPFASPPPLPFQFSNGMGLNKKKEKEEETNWIFRRRLCVLLLALPWANKQNAKVLTDCQVPISDDERVNGWQSITNWIGLGVCLAVTHCRSVQMIFNRICDSCTRLLLDGEWVRAPVDRWYCHHYPAAPTRPLLYWSKSISR